MLDYENKMHFMLTLISSVESESDVVSYRLISLFLKDYLAVKSLICVQASLAQDQSQTDYIWPRRACYANTHATHDSAKITAGWFLFPSVCRMMQRMWILRPPCQLGLWEIINMQLRLTTVSIC